jgi:signal transduction histidine kinase
LLGRYRGAEARYAANVERTRQADRDRAAFLAAVSHEFYTPLNAILGFADVLLAEVDGPLRPDAREEVEQIRDSGKHLKDLIDDIVQFSALEGGQLRLKKKRADLVALANEVVREASVVAHEKGITITFNAPAPVHADIDGLRMRQVLGNLVGNAVKFTSQGGVEVEISRRDRSPMITVTDTGPGISKAERSYVFDEFVQAEAGRRAGSSGSGLGLAIARRLVLLHGGTIELESELGAGSTFRVLLPEAGAVERFGVGPVV